MRRSGGYRRRDSGVSLAFLEGSKAPGVGKLLLQAAGYSGVQVHVYTMYIYMYMYNICHRQTATSIIIQNTAHFVHVYTVHVHAHVCIHTL